MAAMADRTGPGIAVVEYPMGWGKTEIALWMAARWAAKDGIDGFYVAMPDPDDQRPALHPGRHP